MTRRSLRVLFLLSLLVSPACDPESSDKKGVEARTPAPTEGVPRKPENTIRSPVVTGRFASVSLDLIDDKIYGWVWNGKGEFYLKIESSLDPDAAVLLPVNVGRWSGARSSVHRTALPFRGEQETLKFELLHHRKFTPESRQKILIACEAGGALVWTAGQLLVLKNPSLTAWQKGTDSLSAFARATGEVVLDQFDKQQFSGIGTNKYLVGKVPVLDERSANPVYVLDNYYDTRRLEIRVYFPKE